MANRIVAADYAIIAIHFLITVAVGVWSTFKGHRGTSKGYFLAGRDMSWWLVGMSLYVSNIGSASFIGLSGAAAANGIAVICYEFTGLFCILLLTFVFVPVYISAGVYTMPEYLRKRFGSQRLQVYLAVQSLILFVFTKLSIEIYAGAIIIRETLQWDLYLSVAILLAATALYTVIGGLAAVIYTDALQTIVLIIGAIILAIISMVKIGGFESMKEMYFDAIPNITVANTTCGIPDPRAFHIFRPADDPNYPWTGVAFGANVLSAWYFCTDQVLVQRTLAAKNTIHAKAGGILAGYLKILPMFLMVWPGLVSRALNKDTVGCADPTICEKVCGNPSGCSNIAYPRLVIDLMPDGLRGLMLAALLAALMSSLTSIFNSGSTVFTIDIWKRFRKNASEWELMLVGRLFVVVFVGFSVAWVPTVGQAKDGQLFNYLQSINSYLAPPVLACFTMAIAFKRINEKGAFSGLMVGLILGLVRMISHFALGSPICGQPEYRPDIIAKWHYLNYAAFLFVTCLIVTGVVSLLTQPQPQELLINLTWGTRHCFTQNKSELNGDDVGDVQLTERMADTVGSKPEIEDREKENEEPNMSMKQKVLYFFCGIGGKKDEATKEEQEAMERKLAQLATTEDPFWRRVVNVNVCICMAVGTFCIAFFG